MSSPLDPMKDHIAKMPDGSEFSFFDTGVPDNTVTYETYLLIHGLSFNKRTWGDMLKTKENNVRLVAFNLRGYSGSSDFREDPNNPVIGPAIGNDLISMIYYVVHTLGVLITQGSILSIIAWSLAAASIIAAYGTIEPSASNQWTSYISNIILYEPAGGRALGLPYWPAPVYPGPLSPPVNDPTDGFKRLAASFYEYDEAFYSRPCPSGIHDKDDTVYISSCLIDTSPDLWATCVDGIFEASPYARYSKLQYSQPPPGISEPDNRKAFARAALTAMAKSEVKTIHGISTRNTLTGCTVGVKYIDALMKEIKTNKWYLTWIPGHHNHFVHNLNPQSLWDAIKVTKDSGSVVGR